MPFLRTVFGFLDKLRKDRVDAYAAQSAFFTILSAVPFLMLLLSAVKYIPITQSVLEKGMNEYVPENLRPFAIGIVQEIYSKSPALISITAVVAIWISAKGVQALTAGLNSVYDIEETRPWIILRLHAAFSTLLMVASIVILMLLVVFGNRLEAFFQDKAPLIAQFMEIFISNRMLIIFLILLVVFDIFYTALPNRKATFLGQLPGALLCSLSWMLFSYAFSIYVNYFNGLSMYGSLTTLVLIMMWLYFCMYFILVCGAINVYFNSIFRRIRVWMRNRRREKREKRLEAKARKKNNTKV